MEPCVFDGEWESLCKLLTFDEPDFDTDKFLSPSASSLEPPSTDDAANFYNLPNNETCFPQEITNYENENYHLDAFLSRNLSNLNDGLFGSLFPQEDGSQTSVAETDQSSLATPPKKKARAASKAKGKKILQKDGNDEDEIGNAVSVSDEGSNCSQENNSEGENWASKGKKRASRGSATDPQSLYARKRRERINERLRILQNLVPNGTKVDISTMLEDAVHYVKFLQLQIRLLSSDELWMYAPLAYNGVDISLYRRISPFLLS